MRRLTWLMGCLVLTTALSAAPSVLWRGPSGGYADKPTFADLNGDGRLEVVVATQPGNIVALAGVNGAELWRLETRTEQFLGTPLIGDVDGDQDAEIVITGSRAGSLYCLNAADGQIQWERAGEGEGITGSPCLADLGDGGLSLLTVVADTVECRDAASGAEKWTYPVEDRSDGSVSVGDVGNGPELFVGTNGGRLLCLGPDGALRWQAKLGGRLVKPSVIADADRDGRPEIYTAGSTGVFRVDGTGAVKWRWAPASRGIASSLASSDLDGDGTQELVFTGYDGGLYAVNAAGKQVWRFPILPADSKFVPSSTPALVDINGDGGADALVVSPNSTDPRFYAVSGKSGGKLWEVQTATFSQNCPAVADLDADGRLEVVVCVPQGPEAQMTAYALNVKRDRGWFKYGGDLGSTGSLPAALHDAAYLAASQSPFEVVRSHPKWETELPAPPDTPGPVTPPTPVTPPVPGRPAADIAVQLDGRWLNLSPPPVIVDNRTLVPLRGIFEALGASVKWDNATKTVTAVRPESAEQVETTVKLTIGDTLATINGAPVRLDVPGQLLDNSTYVPLRFIGEAFGATVQWEPRGRNVLITQ